MNLRRSCISCCLWVPLISTSCSSDSGCPFIGSVPFSTMYFSMSRRSNTWLDTGETHGCSGNSLETEQQRHSDFYQFFDSKGKSRELCDVSGGTAWLLTLAHLASSVSTVAQRACNANLCINLRSLTCTNQRHRLGQNLKITSDGGITLVSFSQSVSCS